MKIIFTESNNLNEFLLNIKQEIGGDLIMNLKEMSLEIDSEIGYGKITATRLKGGISFIQFNITLNEDVQIIMKSPKKSHINFAYCSKGKILHQFDESQEKKMINTFQTGIHSNIESESNIIYFEKNKRTIASIISVNTQHQSQDQLVINAKLKDRFIMNSKKNIAFVGSPNLKIAEEVKKLRAIKQKGVVRTLLVEGIVHVILALELDQHKIDVKNSKDKFGLLTRQEMEDVKELSQFIDNYPETSLTVTELSHKIGLTPSKLQEGFKLMHNNTVNDYIRNVRVTKSEVLIKTTDMNISQILYSLGFSSRSYFSKIFKQKYNCSPSQYKAQNKLVVSA